jgi:hypothetical protein
MIRVLVMSLLLAAAGCAGQGAAPVAAAPQACPPWPAALATVTEQATRWLRLTELRPGELHDAPPIAARRWLAAGATPPLVVMSFAGLPLDHPLGPRSFLYDNALALLWFTSTGDEAAARGLAATLVALQNGDGTWGFRLSVDDGFYNAAYVRTGTVAWVTHALGVYLRRYPDAPAEAAAARAVRALLAARRGGGLLEGGRGRWSAHQTTKHPH